MKKLVLLFTILFFLSDAYAERYQGAPGIFMGPPIGEDGRPIQQESSASWKSWLGVALIIIFYATAETLKEIIPVKRNKKKIVPYESLEEALNLKEKYILYLRAFGSENIVGQNDVTSYSASINMPSHYARNIENCIFKTIKNKQRIVALGSVYDMADTPIVKRIFVSDDDWWKSFISTHVKLI